MITHDTNELADTDDTRHVVLCNISGETYGVNIEDIDTVIRYQAITPVPCMPDFVEGVVNLRGKIIPVIDLRKRFGLKVNPPQRDSRIVVVNVADQLIGLIVDAVTRTALIAPEHIEDVGALVVNVKHKFIEAIGKLADHIIILLELKECLSPQETRDMNAAIDTVPTDEDQI